MTRSYLCGERKIESAVGMNRNKSRESKTQDSFTQDKEEEDPRLTLSLQLSTNDESNRSKARGSKAQEKVFT